MKFYGDKGFAWFRGAGYDQAHHDNEQRDEAISGPRHRVAAMTPVRVMISPLNHPLRTELVHRNFVISQ